MKGNCRFEAQAAMIRHLVVEKISLPPDFSTITYEKNHKKIPEGNSLRDLYFKRSI
jgi:hypothetical protein